MAIVVAHGLLLRIARRRRALVPAPRPRIRNIFRWLAFALLADVGAAARRSAALGWSTTAAIFTVRSA